MGIECNSKWIAHSVDSDFCRAVEFEQGNVIFLIQRKEDGVWWRDIARNLRRRCERCGAQKVGNRRAGTDISQSWGWTST
jgi:hypothetical protein